MRLLALLLSALALPGCAVARPFTTTAAPAAGSTVVVAVTWARYRPDAADRFWSLTEATLRDLPQRPGLLGYSVRRTLGGREAWTMTAWTSPEALRGFVRGEAHRQAMAAVDETVEQARFARFTIPAQEFPPSWSAALAALASAPDLGYGAPPAR